MENKTEINVIVHKLNIPAAKDESIGDFTLKLTKAAKDHVLKKLNTANDKCSIYPVEIYSDKIVTNCYMYKENDPDRYYAFKYSRDKNGTFSFGEIYEMERVTSYKPKNNMAVSKSIDNELNCPGWSKINKNIWDNIL